MSFTKLSEPIRLMSGEITTAGKLLESGRAYLDKSERWHAPRAKKGYVTAYFVALHETDEYVRIGKMAYESRLAKEQDNWENNQDNTNGHIPFKDAADYMIKLEDAKPDYFWNVLMPALYSYGNRGTVSIDPPLTGHMVSVGAFFDPERAMELWEYWNN